MAFVRFGWIPNGLLIVPDAFGDFDAGPPDIIVDFENLHCKIPRTSQPYLCLQMLNPPA